MSRTDLLARSLHDLGAAGWFGGVLMGATAANRAPADLDNARQRAAVVNGVWRRWWPVNAAAIGAHLLGGAMLTVTNRQRLSAQQGAATLAAVKTGVTLAAAATAAYSGRLGKQISDAGDVPIVDGTTPSEATPDNVAAALRRQHVLQWVIPALAATLIVLGAAQGEQQRPGHVAAGTLKRATSSP